MFAEGGGSSLPPLLAALRAAFTWSGAPAGPVVVAPPPSTRSALRLTAAEGNPRHLLLSLQDYALNRKISSNQQQHGLANIFSPHLTDKSET